MGYHQVRACGGRKEERVGENAMPAFGVQGKNVLVMETETGRLEPGRNRLNQSLMRTKILKEEDAVIVRSGERKQKESKERNKL